jgi:hypothetical protein
VSVIENVTPGHCVARVGAAGADGGWFTVIDTALRADSHLVVLFTAVT